MSEAKLSEVFPTGSTVANRLLANEELVRFNSERDAVPLSHIYLIWNCRGDHMRYCHLWHE